MLATIQIRRNESVYRVPFVCFALLGSLLLAVAPIAQAGVGDEPTLRLLELMYNSVDTDGTWEWLEVENISGSDIDFSVTPYVLDDNGGGNRTGPNITAGMIPAGGKAVIVDTFDFEENDADARFAKAWGPDINLIRSGFFPGFNNDGDTVAIWDNFSKYGNRDFSTAIFALDYTNIANNAQDGAPTIFYTGNGDNSDVNNWQESVLGQNGAYASRETFIGPAVGERLNADDVASPGAFSLTGSTFSSDPLIFSEIMYDPASNLGGDQAGFEWVEVYNNSGSPLDLTGYVFDDDFSTRKTASNVEGKTIASGDVAILYNNELVTESQMQAAWGASNTYVAVSEWGNLFNGGETIALWASLADYELEANNAGDGDDPTVTPSLTATQLLYGNGDGVWEESNELASIYLEDLSFDDQDGFNWLLSEAGTDGAFVASPMLATEGQQIADHVGGEIGSPGPGFASTGENADFNNDQIVDLADYVIWRDNLGGSGPAGDADGIGGVTATDYAIWKSQFGTNPNITAASTSNGSIPEPGTMALVAISLGCLAIRRGKIALAG